jgi:acetyl-CoA carboxylase biotin carboxyl carrier protein
VSTDLPLTPEDVADIVEILDGSAYQTLDVKTPRFRLRVARDGDAWTQEWDYSDDTAPTAKEAVAEIAHDTDALAIRAPLPGVFYRAPSPGAPAFVEIGSRVGPDTVVGIIETMKLMNPVHAGASGTIAEIRAENGEMIGKHTTLMRIV